MANKNDSDEKNELTVSDLENQNMQKVNAFALRIQIAAAAIASSLILIYIPNIETITITMFLAGFLFDKKYAISIVIITAFGWELFVSMIFGFSGIIFQLIQIKK